MLRICIRRENKNKWERRAPLVPLTAKRLRRQGLDVGVETCAVRVFSDQQYEAHGIPIWTDSRDAQLVLGIKEPSLEWIGPSQVHMAFSHTIKGQAQNMPLLRAYIQKGATLIDFEAIKDERGRRLIAFGRFAGIAGTIDTLWLAGQKLELNSRFSELTKLTQTHTYGDIRTLQGSISALKPLTNTPIGVIIVGSGAVGKGCEEVFQWMGVQRLSAEEILKGDMPHGPWYATLTSRDLFRCKGEKVPLSEYRKLGKKAFESRLNRYLGRFDVLIHASYWDDRYPRHLSQDRMKKYETRLPWMIGDISCDIEGSLACTKKITDIDHPAFSYQVATNSIHDGLSWVGPSIMSIDNLPCQLPVDSSNHFSMTLEGLVPLVADMDLTEPLDRCGLPPMLQRATVVYNGQLTPSFSYLQEHLDASRAYNPEAGIGLGESGYS